MGLGELCLKRQRWHELDDVLRRLEGDGTDGSSVEAAVLRARGYLERKEFAAARWTLTEVLETHPRELQPRVILSHVLLQEGRDMVAAEKALCDVLAIDPNHREASHNLEILQLRKQSAPA
jgi:Tfp pilus assembly protein PilF